ncbi:hypothetical protein PHYSODRAFT_444601, partial [Phytophthora sojae]
SSEVMASESALPSPPPFLAATLVLRSRAIFASLVQDSVTAFLDSAVEMELWQACKMNSAALLEHIWQGSAPETEPSPASLGPGNGGRWSRRKFLRTDRHYRRFQFRRAIVEAVKQDKAMELAQWLYAHFHGCIGNVVRWGRHDMARAAERKDNMHVVQWLHDNTPRVPRCIRAALFNAVRNGDVKMLRWFCAEYRTRVAAPPMENIMELMQEDREGLMVGENARELLCGSPQDFMREAVLGGHLSMMRWLLKNGYAR